MSVITLTTDFGTRDWFVGTMKGVIASLAPGTEIIDITHDVPPGDIRPAAFALAAAAPYFPDGTVHVAVVDPGVGSARRAIALRTDGAIFVGPDNGVLSWAVRDKRIDDIRVLSNHDWFRQPVSQTFHGRDVFAPVAARLASGASFSGAGEAIDDFVRLKWPETEGGDRRLGGEVVYVDRFGNAISNLPLGDLPPGANDGRRVRLSCGGVSVALHDCYASVAKGEPLAVAGSSTYLECAINGGEFARLYGVREGSKVEATW